MNAEKLTNIINIAKGEEKAELVLKNANVVDVFSHKILECDVAIADGKIVGLGEYNGYCEVDLHGNYVMPSFVDAHIHIESSMLSPAQYARAIVPFGVTKIVADPHEIVNVCGENGLSYMINASKDIPFDVHFMLPSCVPATPFDSSGCTLNGEDTLNLFKKYDLFGLGEMMNFPGIISADNDVLKKLECTDKIDGHAPGVRGKNLNAYVNCGIKTDHECISLEEAQEKISLGMYILIREGSGAKNLESLKPLINPYTLRRLMFCTDDKHLDDVLEEGTISNCINKAIDLGVDPIDAITMASLNTCECYGLKNEGAIAPGYKANLLVCGDLTAKNILQVYKDGKLVAKDGEPLFKVPEVDTSKVTNTINIKPLLTSDFDYKFSPDKTVIEVTPNSLYTKGIKCETSEGLNLAAVIERHNATGNIGKAFVKGIGIKNAAVAQSIGHDSHNICVVGDNSFDMLKAVEALGTDGGISIVRNGKVICTFKLPIAGLMSEKPYEEAVKEYEQVFESLKEICGKDDSSLLMIMSFMSLLVIPDVKLSDKGIFDVNQWKFID